MFTGARERDLWDEICQAAYNFLFEAFQTKLDGLQSLCAILILVTANSIAVISHSRYIPWSWSWS